MKYLFFVFTFFIPPTCFSQGGFPWERPLKMALSTDGTTFTNVSIFQDSSGVPSVVKWKGDTLVCAFQWFRLPMNSASWDKVAVKFSYDAGLSWTQPVPITVNGFPINYQRPFDPTLAVINDDSLRIYFSSSDGMPVGGLDSTINTYSASGTDGINFTFEPGPRFDHLTNKVIDPAVIYFSGAWNYAAPIGAPQAGAFHCTSNDGINFLQQNDYTSDMTHNWTGNFMLNDSSELRFYGSGQHIWFNSSSDAIAWNGYLNTNLIGGDPSVVKTGASQYFAVYVGEPYLSSIHENDQRSGISIINNSEFIFIKGINSEKYIYEIYSTAGALETSGMNLRDENISISGIKNGIHFLSIKSGNYSKNFSFLK